MAKKINVSFKENDRDITLYLECSSRGDKSNFIKDCVEFYVNSLNDKGEEKC